MESVLVITILWAAATVAGAVAVLHRKGDRIGAAPLFATASLAAVGMAAYLLVPPPRALAVDVAAVGMAMALWTDIRRRRMLNVTTYSTLAVTLLALAPQTHTLTFLQSTVLGAALAAGFYYLLFLVSRGTGIGLGDVKMALGIGAALGLSGAAWFLIWTSVATIVGGGAVLLLRGRRQTVPFAPFMALGLAAAVFAPWAVGL